MTETELQQARALIRDFIEWMVEFLSGQIGSDAPTYNSFHREADWIKAPIIDPAARRPLLDAWQAFYQDFRSSESLYRIDRAPERSLTEHGLYGAQLQAKLRMVAVLALRFETLLSQTQQEVMSPVEKRSWFQFGSRNVGRDETRPRRAKGLVGTLKDLITGIDVFADSALDAVGIGKGLKEIKELFGMSLDDDLA